MMRVGRIPAPLFDRGFAAARSPILLSREPSCLLVIQTCGSFPGNRSAGNSHRDLALGDGVQTR